MEEPSGRSQFRGFALLTSVRDVFGDVVDGLAIDLHRAGAIEFHLDLLATDEIDVFGEFHVFPGEDLGEAEKGS